MMQSPSVRSGPSAMLRRRPNARISDKPSKAFVFELSEALIVAVVESQRVSRLPLDAETLHAAGAHSSDASLVATRDMAAPRDLAGAMLRGSGHWASGASFHYRPPTSNLGVDAGERGTS